MYPSKVLYISLLNSLTLQFFSLISLIDFISVQGVSGSNQKTVCVVVRFASPVAPTRFWAPTRGPNSAAASEICAITTYQTLTRVSHWQKILSLQVVMSWIATLLCHKCNDLDITNTMFKSVCVFFPVFMPQSILFTMTWTMKMELSLCMEVLSDKIIKVCNYAIFFHDKF